MEMELTTREKFCRISAENDTGAADAAVAEDGEPPSEADGVERRPTLAELRTAGKVSASGQLYSSAYRGNRALTKLVLPDGVTSIENGPYDQGAFNDCCSLTGIALPETLIEIGDYCFFGCSKLCEIELPNMLVSIGAVAFYGCSSLLAIALPHTLTAISRGTFQKCSALSEIALPPTTNIISDYAFYGCSSLREVVLPDTVGYLGMFAFQNCISLRKVTLPDTLATVGTGAFEDCAKLQTLVVFRSTCTSTTTPLQADQPTIIHRTNGPPCAVHF
jgi:hypothetical protein